jgi:hypothetical protein
MRAVLKVD